MTSLASPYDLAQRPGRAVYAKHCSNLEHLRLMPKPAQWILGVVVAIIVTTSLRDANAQAGVFTCPVLQDAFDTKVLKDNDVFLQTFPYDLFIDDCRINDFTDLEKDQTVMEQKGLDANRFLTNLFARYLMRHPANPESLDDTKRLVHLANQALTYRTQNRRHAETYRTIGYMLFDNLDERIQVLIAVRRLRRSSPTAPYLLQTLPPNGYSISFPPSLLEKLRLHVRAKDWRYIGRRSQQELVQFRAVVFSMLAVLAGILLGVRQIIVRYKTPRTAGTPKKRPLRKLTFVFTALIAAGVAKAANAQFLSETADHEYYQGDMTIRHLYYGTEAIGSTIWIRRAPNTIRAKYFASGQVFQKYSAFSEKVVLVCSGAFTERQTSGEMTPQGLTVDNGTIVNRSRDPKMDGLVIVYPNGGIAVSDIAKDYLNVTDATNGKQKLDILKSADKTAFLDWAVRNGATVFQTQLLASSTGLRLDVAKAHKEYRERRLLAIVRDNKTNEVYHIIFNVTKSFYLGDITKLIYEYLQTATSMVGLLNLDTGTYDILEVNNPSGQLLTQPAGTKSVTGATNLLVYYHAK